ncbi:MAG: hypothetical protein IPG89_17805 [Bacteroidetes bacterium]|nr:hypothetical protein [Bacteroidota bacterium]
MATITDRKIPVGDMNDNIIGYNAELYTANDYSAFGAPLKGRKFDKTICVPQTIVTPLVNEDFNGSSNAGFVGTNAWVTLQGNRLRVQKNTPSGTSSVFSARKDFTVNSNSDYIVTFDFEVISSGGVTARIRNLNTNAVVQTLSLPANQFASLSFSVATAGTYRLELTTGFVNGTRSFRIDNLFIEETNNTPFVLVTGLTGTPSMGKKETTRFMVMGMRLVLKQEYLTRVWVDG